MADDERDDDKVLRFPGSGGGTSNAEPDDIAETPVSPPGEGDLGLPGLTEDQEKAIRCILSGMSFVFVGMQPAGDGADFFTAVDGDRDLIRNASPHIGGVIDRLLLRRGLD